jgi:hypothetical protein
MTGSGIGFVPRLGDRPKRPLGSKRPCKRRQGSQDRAKTPLRRLADRLDKDIIKQRWNNRGAVLGWVPTDATCGSCWFSPF